MKHIWPKKLTATMLALTLAVVMCAPVNAIFQKADKTVEFVFSQQSTVYARNKNGSPKQQTPIATPYWSGLAQDVTGYTVMYKRTHTGDGKALKVADAAVEAPTQAGTYTAVITFGDNVKFVNQNGEKVQEYSGVFTIKKAEQPPAILRSACAALLDNTERTGGSIEPLEQGVISTRWASGTKPVYMWTKGSGTVVEPEAGKPARFKALAAGEAVLSVRLPEDNNYIKSDAATYIVKVNGEVNTGEGYLLKGDKLNESGWFTSDVTIEPQNGFAEVIVAENNPVTFEGESVAHISLKTADGNSTEPEAVNIKKDTTLPAIENIMLNDSPWSEAPPSEIAWAAATKLTVSAQISDNISGIGKVEYSLDGAEYISSENAVFAQEGIKTFPYTYTIETKGAHTLSLRVTDYAGNVQEKYIAITPPAGDAAASLPPSASTSTAKAVSEVALQEPNEAMLAVSERLLYLHRCNIEARVAGDVRANEGYISETLNLYKQLSSAERKGLGAETLDAIRPYFTALYKLQGKNEEELDELFTFNEEPPPASEISSADVSAAQKKEESIPQPSQSKASSSLPRSSSQSDASGAVAAQGKGGNPFMVLVPIVVLLAAISLYFVWKKRYNGGSGGAENSKAQEEALPQNFDDFDDFSDFK